MSGSTPPYFTVFQSVLLGHLRSSENEPTVKTTKHGGSFVKGQTVEFELNLSNTGETCIKQFMAP